MKSIYNDVFRLVEAEKSAISKKAFDVLNAEGIYNIIEKNGVFWFESYQMGNRCSQAVYDYLKRFIKRKMGFIYLYDLTHRRYMENTVDDIEYKMGWDFKNID